MLTKMSAQVVETSVNNKCLPGDYSHPDDYNQHTENVKVIN